jgi:hypothetical protein
MPVAGAEKRPPKVPVPPPSASIMVILDFALTYDAYRMHGGFSRVVRIAQRTRSKWQKTGAVSVRLPTARAALFFEQRGAHWAGIDGGDVDDVYIRALLDRIRQFSGGSVAVQPDPDVDEG